MKYNPLIEVKFCKDCKYYDGISNAYHRCLHPANIIDYDLVTGYPRLKFNADFMRKNYHGNSCTKDGLWFEK